MSNNFSYLENRAIYEIMWKSIVEPGRSQMTIWHMHIPCWALRLQTHTHNMKYLLLFHCNSSCAQVPQYSLYVHCLHVCMCL